MTTRLCVQDCQCEPRYADTEALSDASDNCGILTGGDRNPAADGGGRGVKREPLDHTGVLNLAGKYLARRADAPAGDYAEPWRFPDR